MSLKIAIHGAAGRMGQVLLELIETDDTLDLSEALEHSGHALLGQNVNGADIEPASQIKFSKISREITADVVVDFSLPLGLSKLLDTLELDPKPLVVGTTGLDDDLQDRLKTYSKKATVIWSPNYSTGVNLLFMLSEIAAKAMGSDVEVEILEAHHRHKMDAPSGTARKLLEVVSGTLGLDPDIAVTNGRSGITGERQKSQIGMHAIRGGDVVGEHTVFFFGNGERLELTHKASSRKAFAAGALLAAKWAASKNEAGLFDMQDVLKQN